MTNHFSTKEKKRGKKRRHRVLFKLGLCIFVLLVILQHLLAKKGMWNSNSLSLGSWIRFAAFVREVTTPYSLN